MPDRRFIHGNLWPYHGEVPLEDPSYVFDPADFDDFLLVGGETSLPTGSCGEDDGAFMTFDWTEDPDTGFLTFDFVDEYRVDAQLPTEGGSPYDQFCAHWFTTHPTFQDGGVVAMGWYEHGTRFLSVDDQGTISDELGWIIPFGASTSAAYWVTEEIVYTTDYQRGVDIVIVDITPTETPAPTTVPGATFVRDDALVPDWMRQSYAERYRCVI
jgi:hypothetical protein